MLLLEKLKTLNRRETMKLITLIVITINVESYLDDSTNKQVRSQVTSHIRPTRVSPKGAGSARSITFLKP